MNWLNENAGVLVLVFSIVVIALSAVMIWLLFHIRNRIAVQKLNFLGFYSTSMDTGKRYADFTVGNRSLHSVGVAEIGLKNGKIAYNLTELYREKAGLPSDAKLVIGQRASITFRLTADELKKTAISRDGKLLVHTIRIYVVDFSGTLFQGRVCAVRKLLKELLREDAAAARTAASLPPKPAEESEVAESEVVENTEA